MKPVLSIILASVLGAAAPSGNDNESRVSYIDASLEPEGKIIGAHFVDIDGDGREELSLALRAPSGDRELHLHRIEDDRVPPTPFRIVPVLDDAVAYGFADVRAEEGSELFFLTRSGVWSFSLTHEGYRGNIRRLVEAELVYDIPDPRSLPFWSYVLPGTPGAGGDRILLPGLDGARVWEPGESATAGVAVEAAAYRPSGVFTLAASQSSEPGARGDGRHGGGHEDRNEHTEIRMGPGGLQIMRETKALGGLLLSDVESGALVDVSNRTRAPALIDVDGDGRPDLISFSDDTLRVHLADASGAIPDGATWVEQVPEYLDREGERLRLDLHDLDGDGRPDLLARLGNEDDDGLGNEEITFHILLNDGRRFFPEEPDQVLRFEAAEIRLQVTDVDGDGRPDLAVRKFEMPGLLDTVMGLEFKLTHLLFLGEEGPRPFQRKPVLKQEHSFDENTIQGAIANRELSMDCDGDGIADLVEVDVQGRIAIRRLLRSESMFRGASWSLEETPWARFDTFGNIESIAVRDLNGDGLGDVLSEGAEVLTILLSHDPERESR